VTTAAAQSTFPPQPTVPASGPSTLGRLVLPAGALLGFFPFVSTAMGLLLGLVLALTLGNPYLETTRKLTPRLLALSVIGLGAGMDLRVVARVGLHGVFYTLAGISLALALGAVLTRLLGVGRIVGALITVGTAREATSAGRISRSAARKDVCIDF
jgi:uncharacterized membrane protein YadS